MSFSRSHTLLAAGLLLFAAACSPGEEAAAPSSETGAVSAEEAQLALAAFGLDEPGRVSWENRTEDDGVYTFTNLTVRDDDGTLTAATMTLAQPRLSDEGPVFRRMTLDEGEIVFPDGVARFDQFLVDEPGPDLADAAAAFFQGRESTFDGENLAAQRFGEIRLTNLSVDGQTDDGGPMQFSLANLQARNSDGETLQSFDLSELSLEASSQEPGGALTMTLGAIEATSVNLAAFSLDPAQSVTSAFSAGDAYDRVAVSDLVINSSGLQISMPSLTAETEARGEDSVYGAVTMPNLTLAADPAGGDMGAQFAMALGQMGYEQFTFSMVSNTVYDKAADRVETEGENSLRFEDGFEMRFDQSLSGVAAYTAAYAAWFADDPASDATPPMAEIMAPLMVERFAIALEDQGLLDRAFAAAAAQQGLEPEVMRMQAAGMIGMMSAFAGDIATPALMAQAQGALMGFISTGGTLEIELAPETPVSAAELAGPQGPARLEAAGLTIRHQAPE
jgi:hypothetical protein